MKLGRSGGAKGKAGCTGCSGRGMGWSEARRAGLTGLGSAERTRGCHRPLPRQLETENGPCRLESRKLALWKESAKLYRSAPGKRLQSSGTSENSVESERWDSGRLSIGEWAQLEESPFFLKRESSAEGVACGQLKNARGVVGTWLE